MGFEFGVFHEFQRRPGQTEAEAFTTAFDQVDAAERWGLDAVWLAELHFAPERSVASAPLVLASAMAARTRRVKIGIAVQVLPLCHPLRLAEEVATLDLISEGRLILGVGLRKGLSECVGVGLCWVARKFLKETKFECHADAHPWALLARLTPAVRRDGGLWKWACGVVSCWPAQWRPARMDGR